MNIYKIVTIITDINCIKKGLGVVARFLDGTNPKLTVMLYAETISDLTALMEKTANQGAEAFCILTQGLKPEYKTKENFKTIIDFAGEKPAYVTNYISNNSEPHLTDDYLAEQLVQLAECGASLVDVRTDMFCRSADEVTRDFYAVEKQKKLIAEIHKLGAEVLMSTHIFEYRSPERILEIAKLQEERGVDIAKIVTMANSEKELQDAFKTNLILNDKLNIPYLFLCNGTHCKKHRLLAPYFGDAFYLCLENSRTGENQPTIEKAKKLREEMMITEVCDEQ